MDGLADIVDLGRYPLADAALCSRCRERLDDEGAVVLRGFLTPRAVESIAAEGEAGRQRAFYSAETHNVYLLPEDPALPSDHPRNRPVTSTKGCITDDLVPSGSALRTLYDSPVFKGFLCEVLGERALYPYADPLSSINIHYAGPGQELGWHFDNSSFAITLMIRGPERGGRFEYVGAVRDAAQGCRRRYAELETTGHAADHPATFPEAQYLKGIYLRF